jgi:hypothetical protein
VCFPRALLILITVPCPDVPGDPARTANVGLLLFIPINLLSILSSVALAGGVCFFISGISILIRKGVLLTVPASMIRDALPGLVQITGHAGGPYSIPAPITGKACYLYRTTAWRKSEGKSQGWEKILDETLHLPFFIADSTGQLLVEPLGADLDLQLDFQKEYDALLSSSTGETLPPRVSAFLMRHGVAPSRHLRIEESLIEPENTLFIAGILSENPGIQVRPFSSSEPALNGSKPDNDHFDGRNPAPFNDSKPRPAQEIIRLSSSVPASVQEMSQQGKIAAALSRAGITKPEAWSAAGIPYQNVAVAERGDRHKRASSSGTEPAQNSELQSSDMNVIPPLVLMKDGDSPTFVISYRNQKELAHSLVWKAAGLISAGTLTVLLGLYVLLVQMKLR